MIGKAGIMLILLALATGSTPALAGHYRYHHYGWFGHGYYDSYLYAGPHYAVSDYYHNSRMLVGTR